MSTPDYSTRYPLDPQRRADLRMSHLEFHTLKGVRAGLRAGISMRCEIGDHHRWSKVLKEHTGCKNDGSNCLCLCHDQ
jgi:hypothetical protein